MTETQVKEFTADLRRSLYLLQILGYSLECLKDNPVCPGWLKFYCNKMQAEKRRLHGDLAHYGKTDSYKLIDEDLSQDRLHDIALHIDAISDIVNLESLTEVIQSLKTEDVKTAA